MPHPKKRASEWEKVRKLAQFTPAFSMLSWKINFYGRRVWLLNHVAIFGNGTSLQWTCGTDRPNNIGGWLKTYIETAGFCMANLSFYVWPLRLGGKKERLFRNAQRLTVKCERGVNNFMWWLSFMWVFWLLRLLFELWTSPVGGVYCCDKAIVWDFGMSEAVFCSVNNNTKWFWPLPALTNRLPWFYMIHSSPNHDLIFLIYSFSQPTSEREWDLLWRSDSWQAG